MIRRTLVEWDTLPYGPGDAEIPQAMAESVAAVAARSPLAGSSGDRVLEYARQALRAKGVVGVVVADGCIVEILPKIDTVGGNTLIGHGAVRRRLIHMLSVAFDLRVEVGTISNLDLQRETLLEVLIAAFVRSLLAAVRQGLPRRYVEVADDVPTLRGRLNLPRQLTKLLAQPYLLACRFDVLSEDTPANQVLKATVHRLAQITQSPGTQHQLRELTGIYAAVSDVPIGALRWDAVIIDRTNERWRSLLKQARLLLEGRFQDTSGGSAPGFSLLFAMHVLFEKYIARMLKRALVDVDVRVVTQGGMRYCLSKDCSSNLFLTKPDIILEDHSGIRRIIDTKWKRMAARVDDLKQGVAQSDVYQMMAYGQIYQCSQLTLLYPHHPNLGIDTIRDEYQWRLSGQGLGLSSLRLISRQIHECCSDCVHCMSANGEVARLAATHSLCREIKAMSIT